MHLDFTKDYILENDFVKLSPLKESHLNDLIDIANEKDIWKYSPSKGDGLTNLTSYINNTIANRQNGKEYPFIVFDKIKKEFAGSTRIYDVIQGFSNIRIGYTWYGEKFRGTGLNKNCKYLLFKFAFEDLNVERIGLGAYIENKISISAMESVGCVKEGVFRSFMPSPNNIGRSDAILLSITKEDWINKEKQKLKEKLGLLKK